MDTQRYYVFYTLYLSAVFAAHFAKASVNLGGDSRAGLFTISHLPAFRA